MKTYVIKAAGGNPTAIRVINNKLIRTDYEKYGKQLMAETEKFGIEQAGFLIRKNDSLSHFEMSGGEFCGNAARSAAVVIYLLGGKDEDAFTMSGFKNTVVSKVRRIDEKTFDTICEFPGLPTIKNPVSTQYGPATVVDLGGIVHVVIEQVFPVNEEAYKSIHSNIMQELKLTEKDAVGVIWITRNGESVIMHPVVWVKSIDTFFYETSCGSGTIAVSATTGMTEIIQPSGESIKATVLADKVILESKMTITYEEDESINYVVIKEIDSPHKKGFIDLYKDAFGGAPYFETYEDSWVEEFVWNKHIQSGCLILAISRDKVVGLGAGLPVNLDDKIYNFLSKQHALPFQLERTLYMSELAVDTLFRKSDLHVGSELVKKRIQWASKNGFVFYVMRTAAENSNSKNIYINTIGAKELTGVIQNVSENPDEVASASSQRIYLYGEVK